METLATQNKIIDNIVDNMTNGFPETQPLGAFNSVASHSSVRPATDVISSQLSVKSPLQKPISIEDRQLPVFCPHCGSQIQIRKGLCGNRLIDAILLQAQRCGTELECHRCRTRFVFQRIEGLPATR